MWWKDLAALHIQKMINTRIIKKYARQSLHCKLSDDLTISFALRQMKVPTRLISSGPQKALEYDGWLTPFQYGEDAGLHVQDPPDGFFMYNTYKYHECWYNHLSKYSK